MPVSLSNQAHVFLCSVLGGILIAFIYDAFRIRRRAVKSGSIIIYVEDLIYWIIAAIVMFGVVYYSNEGEIRGYIFIGAVIGVVLYVLLLSKFIMAAALFILKVLSSIMKFVWVIVSYPFRLIIRILAVPARLTVKAAKKGARGARRIARSRLTKASMLRRMFKNMLKKI